jgi:hypothetical protein
MCFVGLNGMVVTMFERVIWLNVLLTVVFLAVFLSTHSGTLGDLVTIIVFFITVSANMFLFWKETKQKA